MNLRVPAAPSASDAAIREAAVRWVVGRDRGFAPAEAAEFGRWLAADPRHAAALNRSSAAWTLLDRVPAPVAAALAAPRPRPAAVRRAAWGGLAAAAAVTLLFFVTHPGPAEPGALAGAGATPAAARGQAGTVITPDTQLLPDGTVVRVAAGAELAERFSATERRVLLVRGEAYFTVTKDPLRPFVVQAGGATVRAIGTAFNVHLQAGQVDVLVAEGSVRVAPPPAEAGRETAAPAALDPATDSPVVVAGQRAVVALVPAAATPDVVISMVDPAEMAQALARREMLLRLAGATLAELAAVFEHRSGTRLILADPALGVLRIGGRFRGDDVEGFVRVLENTYGIRSERATDGSLVLTKPK